MAHALADPAPAPRPRDRFPLWMALTCLTVSVVGFAPTYFIGMALGLFQAEPIVHIHGMVVFSWMIFFCVQAWLATEGRYAAHRRWGVLGVAIITAMVCTTFAIVALRVTQAELPGQPARAAHSVRAFAWVNIGGVSFVAAMVAAAITQVRRPEVHRRLMLVATVAMLGAPIARWVLLFIAGMPDPHPPSLPNGVPLGGAPPSFVAIPPSLLGDLVLVVAMLRDRRTLGRVHPAYWIGGGLLLLFQLTMPLVAGSVAWQSIAEAIGRLGG